MTVFKYKALDSENRAIKGLVEAVNEEAAVEVLREKNFSVLFVKEENEGSVKSPTILDRIKPKDIVIFSRQFSVLISANVAMVQSLKVLVEQTENMKLKLIVSELSDEVDSGTKLSDALAKYPKVFSNFFVSVVRSGETSGKLEEVLGYLADEMEKDYDMMSKIRGAMIYPIFVLSGLVVVGGAMMIFVIPQLTAILIETGGELPFATRALIAVSDFLKNFWWFLIMLVIAVFLGIKYYSSTVSGLRRLDYIKLRLPIFGKLFQKIYLVRFTRSMHTLIVGGVTITKGLKIASEVVSNQVYKELIEETVKQVEEGNSISMVFSDSKEIPKMVSQMMNIGEKTGKLDIILKRITDFYGREINNTVTNLMTLMEPIIMVVMGVAVGIMVAAIILPMYNMAAQG
ncbi:MAG: Tfp pilus biogenesis protein PilC [Parcubacteria group bacterium GW2011_GWE2_39_37]|uniref:Tfp pilus biogenesis protein PilC n=1 Tax=Candidatus Falkowbacteria bacterium GW2011_GWF2_39_8 TaxID=1618642 RepID=A0A0G0T473_9BACT|nr:MAG: Tfp pilus biogenesis protein PilC [Parcubacteria group bacterium GW2011_GWE2_39_37]KKR32592.1 MAG: Tfp pilus biogenesis protein PilC [Candidatus Falkowbacteria bacterium GW2011_GWF2_39_8]